MLLKARKEFYWNHLRHLYHSVFDRIIEKGELPDGNSFFFRPFSSDKWVEDDIYSLQVYDGLSRPAMGCVVFDVGAHIGLFTLKASKLVGKTGLIFAIEPHPANYSLLRRNIALNSLTNVRAINAAAGAKRGRTKLYVSKSDPAGHSTVTMPDPLCKQCIEVPLLTLDDLGKDVDSERIFIKMDCEGAELEVLRGAKRTLEKGDVTVALSVYHSPRQKEEVEKYLRSKGFKTSTKLEGYLYARNR